MTTLGIETSTAVCGVAIVENDAIVAEHWCEENRMHSEKLVAMIDQALHDANRTLSACDAIAISIGPGSFSGLRIGLSVAKGVSLASDLPLAAVPTLYALAYRSLMQKQLRSRDRVLAMIDAGRDEVYTALYEYTDDNLEEMRSPCAISLSELDTAISSERNTIFLMGDAVEKFIAYRKKLKGSIAENVTIPPREERLCSAVAVAVVGEKLVRYGEIADLGILEPYYIKEFSTTMKHHHTEIHR